MRIYVVKSVADGAVVRYVRAANLNAAVRAVAHERFSAAVATTEDIYQASKSGVLDVLDASTPAALEAANSRAPTLTDEVPRPNSRMPT